MGLSRSGSGADVLAETTSLPVAVVAPSSAPVPARPTPLQVKIAKHRTAIVSGTVAGHFAHWQYLVRFRHVNPYAAGNRHFLAAAGLGWGLVYLGILSTVTFAQRTIHRHDDHHLLRR